MYANNNARKSSGIPWQAPATIVLSLTVGILLAIGHHLFYSSLHGREAVGNGYKILGADVSPQQLYVAIGTAFAFLVKAALITAVSTAYLQLLWRALLRAAGSSLGDLDTAFSGLSNITSLFKAWVWRRLPLLFSLALVAWLLPLAAIITPATLSIEAAQVAPSIPQTVPSLAFESLEFLDDMPAVPQTDDGNSLRFQYTLPSQEVIEVVKAVAATGSILPVNPPSANSSWTLDFNGPALRCTNISEPLISIVQSNVASAMNASSQCVAYGYVAWLENMPFSKAPNSSQYEFNARIFQGPSMPAILYLVGLPEAMKIKAHGMPPAACQEPLGTFFEPEAGAVMLQCELANSKYHTTFHFENGIPNISVSTETIDGPPIQSIEYVNCSTSGPADGSCNLTPATMRTLSYQAIMDALTYLITGYVVTRGNNPSAYIQTQVISTPLAGTNELQFINQPLLEESNAALAKSLQQNILDWKSTRNQGLVRTKSRTGPIPLAETIQQLFQNATVSMMSQAQLQPNASSPLASKPVNVTHETYHNVYTYSKTKLWISYSVAILFTTVASLLGLVAVAASGASFSSSSNFSSAFRLARGAFLSDDVREEDQDGRDPLPAYLANAKMRPKQPRAMQPSRVDSMLLSPRSRRESIALDERPRVKSTSSSASLLGGQVDLEPPAKPWSAL